MRRPTLCAVAALAAAPGAAAQEWSARVGGFVKAGIGYVAADETINNIETTVFNDAEVIVNFRLVADHGLTYGAKVEFEANSGASPVDEYVGFVEGGFGRVEVGAEDGAHDILATTLVGGNFSQAADEEGILFAKNDIRLRTLAQGQDTGDGLKITYYTPTRAGFTAGLSYSPDGREGRTASSNLTRDEDGELVNVGEGVEAGLRWRGTLGPVALRVGAGYTAFLNDANRFDDAYTLNLEAGFAGLRVGAAYGVTSFETSGPAANIVRGVLVEEREVLGLGADYRAGPWYAGAQLGYVLSGPTGRDAAGAQVALSEEDNLGLSFEVNYALAPGVVLAGLAEYGGFGDAPAGVDRDAYAVGAALLLDF